MTATRIRRLEEAIDGPAANVMVRLHADGGVDEAWFSLDGLPRIEPWLRGRPVATVPALIESLCGICPDAHHLAGTRALDALAGGAPHTAVVETSRRLLHHGNILQAHARRLRDVDPRRALDIQAFAGRVIRMSRGRTSSRSSAPSGTGTGVAPADQEMWLRDSTVTVERAADLLDQIPNKRGVDFDGHDVALVDHTGALDLFGTALNAVAADGGLAVNQASPEEWPDIVTESRPGTSAPRPFLRGVDAEDGMYRVGPVAQLRAATHLSTTAAESARQRWSAARGDGARARGVVALHAAEVIHGLLVEPDTDRQPPLETTASPAPTPGSVGTGWVDGPRGLLVHSYRVGNSSELDHATITTPTAQNEHWLATMLHTIVSERARSFIPGGRRPAEELAAALEMAVREADPCLPCTSLPPGRMGLKLSLLNAAGDRGAEWNLNKANHD